MIRLIRADGLAVFEGSGKAAPQEATEILAPSHGVSIADGARSSCNVSDNGFAKEPSAPSAIEVLERATGRHLGVYCGCAFHPYGYKVGLKFWVVSFRKVGQLILCDDCLEGMRTLVCEAVFGPLKNSNQLSGMGTG